MVLLLSACEGPLPTLSLSLQIKTEDLGDSLQQTLSHRPCHLSQGPTMMPGNQMSGVGASPGHGPRGVYWAGELIPALLQNTGILLLALGESIRRAPIANNGGPGLCMQGFQKQSLQK